MSMTDNYAFDLALNLDVLSEGGVLAFVLECYVAAHQLRFFRAALTRTESRRYSSSARTLLDSAFRAAQKSLREEMQPKEDRHAQDQFDRGSFDARIRLRQRRGATGIDTEGREGARRRRCRTCSERRRACESPRDPE